MDVVEIPYQALNTIPGWFPELDYQLFHWVLHDQAVHGMAGDLAEFGVYLGKSAVIIGQYLQPNETFTVVDLFEGDAATPENAKEKNHSYPDLTRKLFERHYQTFHDTLPVVVQGLSTEIVNIARHNAHRFLHVDASHLYEHVAEDVLTARRLLLDNGIVVFDDFRSAHTPGTAAAVWEAVLNQDLRPIAISDQKMYASWGDIVPVQSRLTGWLSQQTRWQYEHQQVAAHSIVRVYERPRTSAPKALLRKYLPQSLVTAKRRFAALR